MADKITIKLGAPEDKVHSRKFKEIPQADVPEAFGQVYVKRELLNAIGNPSELTVTISAG